jgi:AcrR family transcriptional regulator
MFILGYTGPTETTVPRNTSDKPRRTQAQRRSQTMRDLEDAVIRAMVGHGVAGASTTVICRLANKSQGALFQHYDSKESLVVAAVERLYLALRTEVVETLAGLPSEGRAAAAVELLWQSYNRPDVVATLELYASARTRPTLKAALSPMLWQHWEAVRKAAVEALPGLKNRPEVLPIVMWTLQSAAMGSVIEGATVPEFKNILGSLAVILDSN